MCIASISYFICINVIIRVLNLSILLIEGPAARGPRPIPTCTKDEEPKNVMITKVIIF